MTIEYVSMPVLCLHWRLGRALLTSRIRCGELPAIKIGRRWRICWLDIWATEQAPLPRGPLAERYKIPLWTKRDVAKAAGVSLRTVDRWLAAGLPTRNVFGSVRLNPHDVADWLRAQFGMDLHIEARKTPVSHGRPRTQRRFEYGDACATGVDLPLPTRERSANRSPAGPDAPRGRGRRARQGDPR